MLADTMLIICNDVWDRILTREVKDIFGIDDTINREKREREREMKKVYIIYTMYMYIYKHMSLHTVRDYDHI